jgi:hypothetical protein
MEKPFPEEHARILPSVHRFRERVPSFRESRPRAKTPPLTPAQLAFVPCIASLATGNHACAVTDEIVWLLTAGGIAGGILLS